jgi:uncharacterized phage protein (TIGR01671 family)
MREFEFRAWDKKDTVMRIVYGIQFPKISNHGNRTKTLVEMHCGAYERQRAIILSDFTDNIDRIELMQYTGLKDKNGKEIFEGDIVKCAFATGKEPCKVIEEKGCFWVSQKGMKYLQTEAHDNLYWHNSECEVIGNIYENPELLNVKQ